MRASRRFDGMASRVFRALIVVATLLPVATSCSLLIDPEVGKGVGTQCSRDEECQASSCIDGICTIGCNDAAGCPGGAVCAKDLCQLPLAVAYVQGGDPNADELTRSFEDGRLAADASLGYTTSSADPNHPLVTDAVAAASDAVAAGNDVIVSTLPDPGSAFTGFAASHAGVTVLALRSTVTEPGLVSFDARTFPSYYLAGIAAGRLTATNRIGIVATVAMPEVVASVNAYALGAQRVDPGVVVEVVWLHSFHDPAPPSANSMERVLARKLEADGCDIVAHLADNERALDEVAALRGAGSTVRGIGANVDTACNAFAEGTCVGTAYYRWGPLLVDMLDAIHRQTTIAPTYVAGFAPSATESVVGFAVDASVATANVLEAEIDGLRAQLASSDGIAPVFTGPLSSTGQCDSEPCVAASATLSAAQLGSMCWLVDGLVDDAGQPAQVPDEAACVSHD